MPFSLLPWERELDAALFAARAATLSLGVLGLLGAILAITGIFGMASYQVSKRLKEMGIRMALGAGQAQVLRAALGKAFRLLAVGSAARECCLGLAATRVLACIVYQATPRDPMVLAGTVLACCGRAGGHVGSGAARAARQPLHADARGVSGWRKRRFRQRQ